LTSDEAISAHYQHGDLLGAIRASISKLGKTIGEVTIDDLAPIDEFHIGGRPATEHLLNQLGISETHRILDVGCGLGGAARFVASRYGIHVTGIDLTQEYIDTGTAMCEWVGLDDQVALQQGSATAMPFADESFDGGYMLHVGMNIEDKELLFREIYRVLRPGSSFGVYDVMRIKDGDLAFPVPWANEPGASSLATPDRYREALNRAGFATSAGNSRRDFALDFFHKLQEKAKASGGPPPLGIHTLMKESAAVKIKNMIDNIATGIIAPVEIIARKSG